MPLSPDEKTQNKTHIHISRVTLKQQQLSSGPPSRYSDHTRGETTARVYIYIYMHTKHVGNVENDTRLILDKESGGGGEPIEKRKQHTHSGKKVTKHKNKRENQRGQPDITLFLTTSQLPSGEASIYKTNKEIETMTHEDRRIDSR